MINRFLRNILPVAALLAAVAAGGAGCRQHRVISDDTLADIFHDAFVVNAYVSAERILLDSLEIYEPIFRRYGYTTSDVRYTIGNFSRRKSARLGMVVERAIKRLEEENGVLVRNVEILDTIRSVAMREGRRTIVDDSLIRVRKPADSTRLRIVVEPLLPGEYTVSYSYADSSDVDKFPRRASMWLEQRTGVRRASYGFRLRRGDDVRRMFTADTACARLILELGNSDGRKSSNRKPDFTVRNLKIVYTPTESMAVDSLFSRYVDIKIFADEFFPPATDSIALPAHPEGVL